MTPWVPAVLVLPTHSPRTGVSFVIAEPNTVSYSQSSLIHLVGPSDCTLHGFVHGGKTAVMVLAAPCWLLAPVSPQEAAPLPDPVYNVVFSEVQI